MTIQQGPEELAEIAEAMKERRKIQRKRNLGIAIKGLAGLALVVYALDGMHSSIEAVCPSCFQTARSLGSLVGIGDAWPTPTPGEDLSGVMKKGKIEDGVDASLGGPSGTPAPPKAEDGQAPNLPDVKLQPPMTPTPVPFRATPIRERKWEIDPKRPRYLNLLDENAQRQKDFEMLNQFRDPVIQVALGEDDSALALTNDGDAYSLFRILTSGKVDQKWKAQSPTLGVPLRIVAHQGGYVVVYKKTFAENTARYFLVRLTADGMMDSKFSTNTEMDRPPAGLTTTPDGRIVICGAFSKFGGKISHKLLVLKKDGTLDPSFVFETYTFASIDHVAVDPDGKILAFGRHPDVNSTMTNELFRLTPKGVRDTGFRSVSGFDGAATALFVDRFSRAHLCGEFTRLEGNLVGRLLRFSKNGKIDPLSVELFRPDGACHAIVDAPDGGLFIGGRFVYFGGVEAPRVVKLTKTGEVDRKFRVGFGFDRIVNALAVTTKGHLWAGGAFERYQDQDQALFLRVKTDFTFDFGWPETVKMDHEVTVSFMDDRARIYVGIPFDHPSTKTTGMVRRFVRGTEDPDSRVMGLADNDFNFLFLDPKKGLWVGGDFTKAAGLKKNFLARVDFLGKAERDFPRGGGPNGPVRFVICPKKEECIVGGEFTSWGSTPVTGLIRVDLRGAFLSDLNWNLKGGAPSKVWLSEDSMVVFARSDRDGIVRSSLRQLDLAGNLRGPIDMSSNQHKALLHVDRDRQGGFFVMIESLGSQQKAPVQLSRILPDGTIDPNFNCASELDRDRARGLVAVSGGRVMVLGSVGEHGFEIYPAIDGSCRLVPAVQPWIEGVDGLRDAEGRVYLRRSRLVIEPSAAK
jgi:hypothetical protein